MRKQLDIDEADQIVAGHGAGMVEGAAQLWRGPSIPTESAVDDRHVVLALEFRPVPPLAFEIVQILEEQHPRGLLDVV